MPERSPSSQSRRQIEPDAWEVMTNVEFRQLVDGDPDEAVFGFLRLQARVRALRGEYERGRQDGIQETMRRLSS